MRPGTVSLLAGTHPPDTPTGSFERCLGLWLDSVLWLYELYGTVSMLEHVILGDLTPHPEPQTCRVSLRIDSPFLPLKESCVLPRYHMSAARSLVCAWNFT